MGDEINSYKQAYFTFKALNDRAPGDLNNSGMIGLYSNQTYNSNSFPEPYNSNDKNGIPNEISAPFVDLYLAKIIDFKPMQVNKARYDRYDLAKPYSKILTDCQYYFEYGKEDTKNGAHFKINIKPGNIITIKNCNNKINPKYLKAYDMKYDDGIRNSGNIRGNCNSTGSYDGTILNKGHCSSALTLIDY